MHKYKSTQCVASVFIAMVLFLGQASLSHAQLISNEQVEEQSKEVYAALANTLHQHIKLLQMVLIQKLEVRVAHLESLVANK